MAKKTQTKLKDVTNTDYPSSRANKENVGQKRCSKYDQKPILDKTNLFNYFSQTKRFDRRNMKRLSPFGCKRLSPIKSLDISLDLNAIDSTFEELNLSTDGRKFVDLTQSQRDAFFQAFIHNLEIDAGRGSKYGGYDSNGEFRTISIYNISSIVSLISTMPETCQISIFDCRSEEEYHKGHVMHSINVPTHTSMDLRYQEILQNYTVESKQFYIYIFYCEFSSKRAPSMMRRFIKLAQSLPKFLDNIYLLSGGYKDFYEFFKGFCEPMGYLEA